MSESVDCFQMALVAAAPACESTYLCAAWATVGITLAWGHSPPSANFL
ncbi:MAG: hypothetical protein SFX18_08700 [Pirellulales bacterium]|nr:hypothetical protein [Pirellulales bacterium]